MLLPATDDNSLISDPKLRLPVGEYETIQRDLAYFLLLRKLR